MKDIFSSKNTATDWREKYLCSQSELHSKEKAWQGLAQLCCALISHLIRRASAEDVALVNNLQMLAAALQKEEGVVQLQMLIKDIVAQFNTVETRVQTAVSGEADSTPSCSHEQIGILGDIVYIFLDRINFPDRYNSAVEKIKLIFSQPGQMDEYNKLMAGITALTELLMDIFDTVKHDKEKIEHYLQQISVELQHLDKGITTSGLLQSEKQQADEHIKTKVETEVLEMENSMTSLMDIEDFKQTAQKTMLAIRSHLTNFKEQEAKRNQQSSQLVTQLRQKLQVMEQQCQDLQQKVVEKNQQILSDPLTGLRNRLAYEEAILYELERFKRYARPVSLLILDLDKFKQVNDNYGHNVGDKVLQMVARTLAKNIRNVDFLARYGGEEFVIIFPELELREARQVAKKICKAVEDTRLDVDGHSIHMTVSGGIARIHPEDSAESLFERADMALYLAKERGRNRCETE